MILGGAPAPEYKYPTSASFLGNLSQGRRRFFAPSDEGAVERSETEGEIVNIQFWCYIYLSLRLFASQKSTFLGSRLGRCFCASHRGVHWTPAPSSEGGNFVGDDDSASRSDCHLQLFAGCRGRRLPVEVKQVADRSGQRRTSAPTRCCRKLHNNICSIRGCFR